MSQLSTSQALEMAKGLRWHAVIEIKRQPHGGRKVLADYGPVLGGPRFTAMLNDADKIVLEVVDDAGGVHATPPADIPINHGVHLECAIAQVQAPDHYALEVRINDRLVATHRFIGTFVDLPDALGSIGSNVRGDDPAAFTLGELIIFAKNSQSDDERAGLQKYFAEKWNLTGLDDQGAV
jgi:hypothetical protein